MIVLGTYSNEDILHKIGANMPRILFETPRGTFKVKASSVRLQCLKNNQTCVCCGRVGTRWRLEMTRQNQPKVGHNCFIKDCAWCSYRPNEPVIDYQSPHLNLYFVDKGLGNVLMTRDHIKPKCAGGSDHINNAQTMCSTCNGFKAGLLPREYERKLQHHIEWLKEKKLPVSMCGRDIALLKNKIPIDASLTTKNTR